MTISTADRLVQLRKDNGFSQEVLASKLGVSRQAISKWERAEASPDTDNLIALAQIYGLTLDELLAPSKIAEKEIKPQDHTDEIKEVKVNTRKALYPETAKKMFKFPYPLVIVIVYLFLCMGLRNIASFNPWGILWLLFFTVPMYYMVAAACKTTSLKAFLFLMPVPIVIITAYLFCGLVLHSWLMPLIMFLFIPLYYWCVAVYAKSGKKKDRKADKK